MKKYVMCLVFSFFASNTAVGADFRLIKATKAQDARTVHQLIQEQVNVNEQLPDGATALHWAVHRDNLELVELLIQAGAEVNIADQGGATPLWIASYNSNADMVKRLLQAGANPDAPISSGETPLMTASERGNPEIVNALLSVKADVNAREHVSGQTALMWAVAEGHHRITATLIDNGANVHIRSKAGFTALHFASLNGSDESAQILVSMDAEINEISNDKMSPLLLAAASGHDKLTQYLLEHGANPAEKDFRGYTALHYAAMNKNMLESIRSLLASGADPNDRLLNADSEHELQPVDDLPFLKSPTRIVHKGARGATMPTGVTPVYIAAYSRNAPALRLLVENGGNIHLASTETVYHVGGSGRRVNYIAGTTPLMAAAGIDKITENFNAYSTTAEKEALETVKVAIELGADVNATNEYGLSALHGACFINADSIIEHLITNGADIDAKDVIGNTPISIAMDITIAGLGDNNYDVRPRRTSLSTINLLTKLGATPLDKSGIDAR
jgi:ankyrin repeat protein